MRRKPKAVTLMIADVNTRRTVALWANSKNSQPPRIR